MASIGLPHALMHFSMGTLMEDFVKALGHTAVVSPPTTKTILDTGVKLATDATCLPIKAGLGHLATLSAGVDSILFPRWVSIERNCYICPKFMGLPDMAKACIPGLPPLISPSVEGYKDARAVEKAMMEVADELGCNCNMPKTRFGSARQVKKALADALRKNREEPFWRKTVHCSEAFGAQAPVVAVLGHPYNVYDAFLSMNILQCLMDKGYTPLTYEMLSDSFIEAGLKNIRKPIFWTFGRRLVGAAEWIMSNRAALGIIHVASFGCGPDSFTGQMVAWSCEKEGMPFLEITLDEHSGEAGFLTRLEAFTDILERRGPQ